MFLLLKLILHEKIIEVSGGILIRFVVPAMVRTDKQVTDVRTELIGISLNMLLKGTLKTE